jgi:hypothetical protein
LEEKFESEQIWGSRYRNESKVLAGENTALKEKLKKLSSKPKNKDISQEEKQKYIDVGLRMLNIELHQELLKKVLEVVDLVDRKKGSANIQDIIELENKK